METLTESGKKHIEETVESPKAKWGKLRQYVIAVVISTIPPTVFQIFLLRRGTESQNLKLYELLLIIIPTIIVTVILALIIEKLRMRHIKSFLSFLNRLVVSTIIALREGLLATYRFSGRVIWFIFRLPKTVFLWVWKGLISSASFIKNRKLILGLSTLVMVLGFGIVYAVQTRRLDRIEGFFSKKLDNTSSNYEEGQVSDVPHIPNKTNALIFNANNIRGTENSLGAYLRSKISTLRYTHQYDWWLKRTYNRTLIVYITDEYRDQALTIANFLRGKQNVLPYRNTPFVGLEQRDIVIFIGKDLYDFKK